MTLFKITIHDRNYSSWSINPESEVLQNCLNPLKEKLFSKDTFTVKDYQNTNNVQVVHSPIRSGIPIAAVLILLGNKTFGRHNKNKLLYKCIPNNAALPIFLVPYEMKNVGFSKVFKNMYVTISFHEWTDKHPMGFIQQVIGPEPGKTVVPPGEVRRRLGEHERDDHQRDDDALGLLVRQAAFLGLAQDDQ
jgi:hypothetical protein